MITLKEYVSEVLRASPEGADVEFEVNLYPNGSVAGEETGNKVRFTVCNVKEAKNDPN